MWWRKIPSVFGASGFAVVARRSNGGGDGSFNAKGMVWSLCANRWYHSIPMYHVSTDASVACRPIEA